MKKIIFIISAMISVLGCLWGNDNLSVIISRNYHSDMGFDYVPLADYQSDYFKKWIDSEISEEINLSCYNNLCILTESIKDKNGIKEKVIKKKKLRAADMWKIKDKIKKIKEFNKKVIKEEKEIENRRMLFSGKEEETVKYKFNRYRNNTSVSIDPIIYNVSYDKKSNNRNKSEEMDTGRIKYITEDLIEIFEVFGYKNEMLKKPGEISEKDYKNFNYSEKLLTNGNHKEWNLICKDLECIILFTVKNSKEKIQPLKIILTQKKKKEIVERIFKGMEWEERLHVLLDYYPTSEFHLNNGKTYYYKGGTSNIENIEFYKVLDELLERSHKEIESQIIN